MIDMENVERLKRMMRERRDAPDGCQEIVRVKHSVDFLAAQVTMANRRWAANESGPIPIDKKA